MKQWSGREVIAELLKDGWYEVGCEGSHHQFKHPTKKGRTTVKAPARASRERRSTPSNDSPGFDSDKSIKEGIEYEKAGTLHLSCRVWL